TATAGEDYTASQGTVTFAPGETQKTVSVAILQDSHDEGEETFTVQLSDASPTYVAAGGRITRATATGTISNTDPIPQAWVARFGRTVAEQVLDGVEGRMQASRQPGAKMSLGGQQVGLGASRDAPAGDGADDARKTAAEAEAQRAVAELAAWLRDETDPEAGGANAVRTMSQRELLLGTSFSVTAGTEGAGFVSFWGRGVVTHFDGREGTLSLDGEVASAMMGTDWQRGRLKTGLVVAHSLGEGGFRDGKDGDDSAGSGVIEASLTGLYPWASHALTDRLEAWGTAGYGEGSLTLKMPEEPAIRTDMDLWMAAAGLRGMLVDGGGEGLTLTGKTDAMIVETSTDAVSGASTETGNLAAAVAEVTRLRLGLEGTIPVLLTDGSVLTPGFEFGVRHDGGDAETGFGADIGASLAWKDAERGLSAELSGRGLLTHEADGFRERGLSGAFSWDPVGGDRGPHLSLTQTFGGASSGGAEALLARSTMEGLAANDPGSGSGAGGGDDLTSRRLEARFGYGLSAFGDRFSFTPEAGLGLSDTGRDMSLGWRLQRRPRPGDLDSLELSFEARRRESEGGDGSPQHEIGLRLTSRF
ncbi:MAG: hypothetical protein OXE57_13060, partial [Alphaproteobacteria bacterium]|nr:hypothetical protein [Alphaproteobacteria bacterium]